MQILDFFERIAQTLCLPLFTYKNTSVTALSVLLAIAFFVVVLKYLNNVTRWFARKVLSKLTVGRQVKKEALLILKYLLISGAALIALKVTGIDLWLYEEITNFQRDLSAFLDLKLFALGKTQVTVWIAVYLLIFSWLLVRLTGQLEEWLVKLALSKTKVERGMVEGVGAIMRYLVTTLGFVVILQTAGIDLSALTIMAGAAGIALGLGLQAITNNFVSGLVILFERPIKVGDRVEIGGTAGDVVRISLRATTIVTNDDVAIIVPNSEFISSKVINWTFTGRRAGFKFPVKVDCKTDPSLIQKLLMEVAADHPGVLKSPAPSVLLEEITETAMSFALSVWSSDYISKPGRLRSDLNFAIAKKFQDSKIQLPAPAHDIGTLAHTFNQTRSW
jgi:small-conductance mechanosensitive channel